MKFTSYEARGAHCRMTCHTGRASIITLSRGRETRRCCGFTFCDRLKLVRADMGYRGTRLKAWVEQELPRRCRASPDPAHHGAASSVGGRANLHVGRALPNDEQRL